MTPSRVAFCGASGTGKTALATWIEKTHGLPMNPVGCRSLIKEMGLTSAYESDALGRRNEFQWRLVQEKTAWEAAHDTFVTDRTTFDNLAYSMLHDARQVRTELFDLACQGMTRYEYVIYCPVSVYINLGDDDVTRLPDLTYHRLFDAALWGLLQKFRPPLVRLVTLPFASLHHRKDFVASLMKDGYSLPQLVGTLTSAR